MDWDGLAWIGVARDGLAWTGMHWDGLRWIENGMDWHELDDGLGWTGMDWDEMDRDGLGLIKIAWE